MDYLVRFVQFHESFRKPEIEALAELNSVKVDWVFYSNDSPFAILRFPDVEHGDEAAKSLTRRAILSHGVYELWGSGTDYSTLHSDTRARTESLWQQYSQGSSFRFGINSFQGSRSLDEQRDIIDTFSYTGFTGPIRLKNPDNHFTVFEEYDLDAPLPKKLYFGRLVGKSDRRATVKYSLKQRKYISTTSMDAELSLVTANLALAAPGKLSYDPFMGTGSFPLSCAHFGSTVFGSDLDGRSVRGKNGRNVKTNFEQYDTSSQYLGGFVADLTNTPLRAHRILDSIVCDPPYGVREGLKVLGSVKASLQEEVLLEDGQPAHLSDSYLPPKRPYSFTRMLDDILEFSATMLVDGGRLCMWMPVAGITAEDDAENGEKATVYGIPQHPQLDVVSECTQHFNKWSRRLLTYRRRNDLDVDEDQLLAYRVQRLELANGTSHGSRGGTADDLNDFRKKYFKGFLDPALPRKHEKLPHNY